MKTTKNGLISKLFASALISGLVGGATAFANEGASTSGDQSQMSGDKNSCKGKKDSCKGMAHSKGTKKKMDKNSCSGKDGCGEKDKKDGASQE